MQDESDLFNYKHYSAIDFVIGLLITLGASTLNALGLNITKRDFSHQESLPPSSRRPDYLRPWWWLGLTLYIISQVVGSTLALEFLRAEYVAPLGSSSLIFNFIFAYLLVGTPVTRTDIIGTFVIVLGVVGVVVFSNQRASSPIDTESNLSLSLLKQLWSRSSWITYLTFLELFTVLSFWFSLIMHEVCMARVEDERGDAERERELGTGGARKVQVQGWKGWVEKVGKSYGGVRSGVKTMLEKWSQSKADTVIRKTAGLGWSITGGLLAGQTLVFAKSAVKLVTSAITKSDPNEANQFTSPLSWLIVILLVASAVSQVYCLTASLKCYDSTFTVPIFFATYTTCGFLNSLVYLDELHLYKLWAFLSIWFSIFVLIAGVILLSTKKPSPSTKSTTLDDAESGAAGGEFDSISLTPPIGSEGKKFAKDESGGSGGGRSWFGKKGERIEMKQSDRRKLAGVTKLEDERDGDDVDSVLETKSRGGDEEAKEVERDEIDELEFGEFEGAENPFESEGEREMKEVESAKR